MYSATKVSLFVANYSKELRIEANMKRKVKLKLIKVDGVEEWEVDKILNKRKIREVVKYLV